MSSAAADSLELHLASARIGRAFRRRAARKELAEQRALMTASEEADIPDGGEALKKHYMEEHGKVPAGRILGLCFSDIPIIAGIIFLSIVQIFATVGFFLSFALFVDDLTTVDANSNKAAVVSTSLLVTMLIISVIMSLLIMGKSILLNAGANTLAIRMRKQLLYAVAMRPISWFDRNRIADISNSLGPAVSLITEGVFQAIVNSWWAFVMIITCMVVLGLLNVKSMLITLAVLVLAFTTFIQTEIKEKYYKDLNQAVTQSDVELTEFVSRIRPIRAAATERKEMEDYTSRVELAADLRKRMAFIDGIFDGVNTFIAAAVLLVLLWFDGGLVEDGKMSVGKLITAIAVGGVIMTYFRLLFKNIGGCISTVDSCQVTLHMLTDPPSEDPADSVKHLYEGKVADFTRDGFGEISFKDVHFFNPANPSQEMLQGFSIVVPPGKSMAFLGQAGCGKSFLLSLLTRFYRPESGTVAIDGIPCDDYDITYASQVGLVMQEQMMLNGSIWYNIAYGADGNVTFEDVQMAAKLADAHRFIMRLPQAYDTVVGDGQPVRLAPAQMQRIAIARVFAKNPPMVLLDDPCAALDKDSKYNVRLALRRMVRNPVRRTAIVIAHDPDDCEYTDIVTTMINGKVVESDYKETLLEKKGSYYNRLLDGQIKYVTGRSSMNPSAKVQSLSKHQKKKLKEKRDAKAAASSKRLAPGSVAPQPSPGGYSSGPVQESASAATAGNGGTFFSKMFLDGTPRKQPATADIVVEEL